LKGERGRGTLAKEKPPVLGMIQRGGQVVIKMLPDVQQQTIKPIITETITPGATVMTDEYDIYNRLPAWGYGHDTVCHSRGEFARDEDGDGFCEVHVNTIEGFSLVAALLPCDQIAVSRRNCCRSISDSLNLCTMSANAGKRCSDRFSRFC